MECRSERSASASAGQWTESNFIAQLQELAGLGLDALRPDASVVEMLGQLLTCPGGVWVSGCQQGDEQ